MRSYAIGDIHGQIDKLIEVHDLIEDDRARTGDADAPVIHLGDFVDRGIDVRATIDHLIQGKEAGKPWVFLKGNHDRMMTYYLQSPEQPDPFRENLHWLQDGIGGRETLAAYGVDVFGRLSPSDIHAQAIRCVPADHLEFLSTLATSYRRGEAFFCHAGVRPGIALDQQAEDDLIWIRQEFHNSDADHGALIVHGHTPVKQVTHYGNRVNIDTGAAYGRALSVVVVEDRRVYQLTAEGRVPIPEGGG